MDPIADKLLVTSVMIMFVIFAAYAWIGGHYFARDLVVNGLRMLSASLGQVPAMRLVNGKRLPK